MAKSTGQRKGRGPRYQFAVTLDAEAAKRVRAHAERAQLTPTAAAAALILIGLEAEAGRYEPNAKFDALGYTLALIADRLDKLDRVAETGARGAIKSAILLNRQTSKDLGRTEADSLNRKINEAVESALKNGV